VSTLGEFLSTSLISGGMKTATPLRKESICLYSCLSLGFVLCLGVRIDRRIN
jgi:hypothetical protein